ncbi:diguanylate cyclase [Massilia sp. Dwa41.01b]|uniref:tetratricopeptide repeat-containing diguanylate cyclase n=1 Tax=unclassified Massilia TaxID=2609279 RepID=UPI001601BEC1|nr:MULTISPECIES: GGDEF domain-containing protein [unclassified Massilia]QNA90260.1 diguanylate cyclase [Massilia sp. Dwa41.01b]QNB01158.1 diguanylate cyclase [Massilia sp. Se16.2.3]
MSAASKKRPSSRRPAALLAALLLASGCAWGQAPATLDARLLELREINRFVPERALPLLLAIEPEARGGSRANKVEILTEVCSAYTWLGKFDRALAYCEELIALGRAEQDKDILASGLLHKAYLVFARNEQAQSHELVWEAERLAKDSKNAELLIRIGLTSSQAYGEEGNFPRALERMQRTLTYARQHGKEVQVAIVLDSLANLYAQMHEYDKGFAALSEAMAIASKTASPGRRASLKSTEYFLAVETGQMDRALKAQLEALALQRQIGAESSVPYSLVNLSDCYLKMRDYAHALEYSLQALKAAQALNDQVLVATAQVNIGQVQIARGHLAEGKRSFEQGLAIYEKTENKPEIQDVLIEYGDALERAGDFAGAVKAYHRERSISNELFEKRRQKAMLELQEKYDADRKQRQIELLKTENQVKSTEIANRRLQQRVWWLLAVVFALAAVVVGMLYRKVRHANAQLHEKNQELKQQSVRDPLTGLYNRRHFQDFMRGHQRSEKVIVEKRGAGTSGEEMVSALFLMDVDHFKHINDTWGHGAGDAVLVKMSESLREILRETDMIVRWGGEEFLAFLPSIPRNGLDEVARRLLNGIADTKIQYGDMTLSANVSIGYAPYPLAPNGISLPWERAVNLVDMALYMAKGHGRNRAYGVRGFAKSGNTSMEEIEQNLEQAWREGQVDMAIVAGGYPELRASA